MAYEEEIEQTITGRTYEECKEKLFNTYGKDFRITDKKIDFRPGGFLYLKKKPVTVVTYVVNHQKSYSPDSGRYSYQEKYSEEELMAKNREAILQNQSNVMLNKTINEMSKTIEDMKNEMSNQLKNISISAQEKHESIKRIDEMLEQNEFSFSYINMIEEKIRNDFSLEQLDNFDLVERRVVDWIGESISVAKDTTFRPPHVYIIVGPTGVGKTTTLVKLATMFMRAAKKNNKTLNFCFITTDTMRVGAMEQLSRFGEVIGKNVLKAQTNEDVQKLYEEYKDYSDAIFIDTGGYGPNDAQHLADMKTMLSVQGMNPDVYLTVTASTKARDLNTIMQNYEPFGYQSVIITKCDESEQYGNVISVLHERHKSISYITNGQKITQTIAKADVVEFLKRLEGFAIDRVHIEDKFNKDDILGEQ